jgi:hypothetical protein
MIAKSSSPYGFAVGVTCSNTAGVTSSKNGKVNSCRVTL